MSEPDTPSTGATPAPEPAAKPQGPGPITIDQFSKVELRAARVLAAEPHPDADRLLVLKVDAGDPEPRQLVAGIRADWEPAALVGRTVVIVANLLPARLRGVESQGMLLAVRGTQKVIPLGVDGDVAPGTRVT
jgi:methionine--tRNA ligase beta chain